MKRCLIILPFLLLLFTQAFGQTQPSLRIGLMGDSSMDEYRGTDNRGDTLNYAAVTFNWIEQLAKWRGVDVGAWGTYPEPRRTGYAYNWARSGANSSTLLAAGEHTGLAAQVAEGKIDLVIVCIGGNDFAPWAGGAYAAIYDGRLAGDALQRMIDGVVANIATAVDTILRVHKLPMIISLVGDFEHSPQIVNVPQFSDPLKRKRVSDAIQNVNDGIIRLVNKRGLDVFDPNSLSDTVFGSVTNGFLILNGVAINVNTAGDEPHNLLLGDYIHGGTVLEGFIANGYLAEINKLVEPDIIPFSNTDILFHAGLGPAPTMTPSVTPTLVPTSLPNAAPSLNYFTASSTVLTWERVSWADRYELQLSRNAAFSDLITVNNPLPADTLSYLTPVLPDGTYYWRVRAVKGDQMAGSWSATQTFTLKVTTVANVQVMPTLSPLPTPNATPVS